MIGIALYHPQIPQNTGTLLRTASCLGMHVDLIRPFGFIFDDRRLRRAAMDYLQASSYKIHDSFEEFYDRYGEKNRIIALDVGADSSPHCDFKYMDGDILAIGSEHYGFLDDDLKKIHFRVKIPMLPSCRSLNMAISASIVISEAMSQLKLFCH